MNTFFSIIVPVYNPNRLEQALNSIESQSNKEDIEVIIVDDNSTNKDYQKLLTNYSFNYKLIESEKNNGPGLARQIGMDNATGQWITFLDHDDEFSPDCFLDIKNFIEKNKCEFILVTNIIIADDFNWMYNNNYRVDNNNNHLHGKFYNLQKLKEYNIHFHPELKAQEDTYFLSLLDGLILLDGSIENNPKIKMNFDLITYYWYLWKDSTSHKVSEDERKISYLEQTFKEYIIANFDSYKICSTLFPKNMEFKYYRCISLLFYCYWFFESFIFLNSKYYLKENLIYIKNIQNLIIEELELISKEELVSIILDSSDMYRITSQAILVNTEAFIPIHSVKEFFLEL